MTIEFLTISLILVVIIVGVILIVQANKTKDLREEITDISEYQNNRIKTLEDKIEILINILKINK